ncbi:MAG: hypothetical protein JW795_07815 [Chitinivibrionales bacterium]|nr:hypothetical protein [Chitinivibrionales bacterium]
MTETPQHVFIACLHYCLNTIIINNRYCLIDTNLALLSQYAPLSTDTSVNPIAVMDTSGRTERVTVHVLEPDAEFQSILFPSFKGIAPNGVWYIKKDRSQILAQYDLGLGNPFDSATGKSRIYVPSVTVSVNPADTTIQQITVQWYCWNAISGGYV